MESMVLKMRKMKDSGIEWIGMIPEGWEVCRLKNIVACHDELRKPISADKRENHLKLYDYYGASGVIDTIDDYNVDGTVLLIGEDGANLKLRNLPLIYRASGKFWVNNHAHILIVNKKYSYDYVAYLLEAGDYSNYITGSAQPKLSQFNLMRFPVAIPNYTEQENISFFIHRECSKIDSILSETRSSIEEYKKLKQAVITQAVTKGVCGEREMKDSGVDWIGEIPKEWTCEKIKYATSISRGLFNHRPRNDERYYNGKYPFIQTGDVANATKYIVSYSQTLNELGKAVSKEFPKGTLTMTIAANVGDVAILNFDAYFPDSVVGFIPNKNIRTLYLFYVFSAMKDEFTRTAIKSTQLNLNIDRVKETFIPVTLNVNEQCEIENYLESKCAEIDGLIAKKEQLVKELESYKKSLIYEVVTGKREV